MKGWINKAIGWNLVIFVFIGCWDSKNSNNESEDTDSNTVTDIDVDTDMDTDTDMDNDTDVDSETDTDSATENDTNTETETSVCTPNCPYYLYTEVICEIMGGTIAEEYETCDETQICCNPPNTLELSGQLTRTVTVTDDGVGGAWYLIMQECGNIETVVAGCGENDVDLAEMETEHLFECSIETESLDTGMTYEVFGWFTEDTIEECGEEPTSGDLITENCYQFEFHPFEKIMGVELVLNSTLP